MQQKYQATCSGPFQHHRARVSRLTQADVDLLPGGLWISELTSSHNPPYPLSQHPPALDPKPWSGTRGKISMHFLSSHLKSLESPSTWPSACPSANYSSEQDGWMGWILALGGKTMSHLSKFIYKLSVILSSWIFFSLLPTFTTHKSYSYDFPKWLNCLSPSHSSSYLTKAKWTLLRERRKRKGERHRDETRKKVKAWNIHATSNFEPSEVHLSLPLDFY